MEHKPMKKYLTVGRLVKELETAYVAATLARKLAHQLLCKVQKRKNLCPKKLDAARNQKRRATRNWNKIYGELKRYSKMKDLLTVICYGGFIVRKVYNIPCQQIGRALRININQQVEIKADCIVLDFAGFLPSSPEPQQC
jgi:hypothetical protein